MKELLFAFMLMASRISGLPPAADIPQMNFLPQEEMCKAVDMCEEVAIGAVVIAAHYDMDTRVLTLPVKWSFEKPYDLSSLIHEMVHHLQAEKWPDGIGRPCNGLVEKQAYDAEDKFLAMMDLQSEIGPLFRLMMTACDE